MTRRYTLVRVPRALPYEPPSVRWFETGVLYGVPFGVPSDIRCCESCVGLLWTMDGGKGSSERLRLMPSHSLIVDACHVQPRSYQHEVGVASKKMSRVSD